MSKKLYKQESAKKLKKLLTHFLQEKDNDWKTVRKEFAKKMGIGIQIMLPDGSGFALNSVRLKDVAKAV